MHQKPNCHLNTAFYRTLDPQLGRWWQIDPEVEQFEAWSAYNSNLDNPILHTDPEGDCTDCLITVGGLLETAFYDAKHALFNVGAYGVQLATGSEGRYVADYQTDGSGTPIFGTSYQYVTNETQGQKALSLAGDVLQVASLANGGASSLTLAKTTNQSKQTVKAVSHGNSKTSTKTQHGYVIKENGKIQEYGISGQKLKADGTSPRVQQKIATKYNGNPNVKGQVIKKNMPNRTKALNWEKGKAKAYRVSPNNPKPGQNPPQQKRPK